jgi:hypothetical protein
MKFYKTYFSTFKKSGAKQWSKTVEQNSGAKQWSKTVE